MYIYIGMNINIKNTHTCIHIYIYTLIYLYMCCVWQAWVHMHHSKLAAAAALWLQCDPKRQAADFGRELTAPFLCSLGVTQVQE